MRTWEPKDFPPGHPARDAYVEWRDRAYTAGLRGDLAPSDHVAEMLAVVANALRAADERPIAWLWQHEETGRTVVWWSDLPPSARHSLIGPLVLGRYAGNRERDDMTEPGTESPRKPIDLFRLKVEVSREELVSRYRELIEELDRSTELDHTTTYVDLFRDALDEHESNLSERVPRIEARLEVASAKLHMAIGELQDLECHLLTHADQGALAVSVLHLTEAANLVEEVRAALPPDRGTEP